MGEYGWTIGMIVRSRWMCYSRQSGASKRSEWCTIETESTHCSTPGPSSSLTVSSQLLTEPFTQLTPQRFRACLYHLGRSTFPDLHSQLFRSIWKSIAFLESFRERQGILNKASP